jgi:hypothetical protein
MTKLSNLFSWSFSAHADFLACPRRRYWSKYALWNGWQSQASALERTAYRLSKMDNLFSLQGQAVERALLWALRAAQAGRTVDVEQAYAAAAQPFLNQCWSESRQKLWQANPRRHCCLHEHYYAQLHAQPATALIPRIIANTKQCLGHFLDQVLPRLRAIRSAQEIPIAQPGNGPPESFQLDGVKIYAIPDYAYWQDEQMHIHEWKSGQPLAAHSQQITLYGLWAQRQHHLPAHQIHLHLEYLLPGRTFSAVVTEAELLSIQQLVQESVAGMAEYLEGGDLRRNIPLSQEHWELTADQQLCRSCNFYELCQAELES